MKDLPRDIADHARLRFHHGRSYNVLQKFAYGGLLIIVIPLIIATGLTMSPGVDASWPWLLDVFGGRQTARTIHFICMALIVLFFVVHMLMVLAAGPLNELSSIVTGWYRTDDRIPKKRRPEMARFNINRRHFLAAAGDRRRDTAACRLRRLRLCSATTTACGRCWRARTT